MPVLPTKQAWDRTRRVVQYVERIPDYAASGARRIPNGALSDLSVQVIGDRGIPQYGIFYKTEYRHDSRDYGVDIPNAAGLRSIGIAADHISPSGGRGQGYDHGDRLVLWYERTTDYTPAMREGFCMGTVKDEPFASYDPFGPLLCLQIVTYPQAGSPGLALVRFRC